MSSVTNLTAVRAMISNAPREELQILTRGLCEELELVNSQMDGIIQGEANAEATVQALRKELDATKAVLGATKVKLDTSEEVAKVATATLGKLQNELDASKAQASAMGAMVVTMKKELSKEAREHARLLKQLLVLENQLRDSKAQLLAAKEATKMMAGAWLRAARPRRRSPRLAEVAAKKSTKV
jgi:chromosome segregation ATPase